MKPVDQKLDSAVNWNKRSVQRFVAEFMEDTINRIKENFFIQRIGRHNPNAHWESRGSLENSIYATVVNNAGGDMTLVRFFYYYYGSYVELAVQRAMPYSPIPEMASKEAVVVPGKSRLAKPAINSQIRRGANRLITRVGLEYTYVAAASFMWGVDVPNSPTIHSKNEKSLDELYRFLNNQ